MRNRAKVKLKEGHSVHQPVAKPWSYGYIDGYVRGANDVPCVVVITEHGELELCDFTTLMVKNTKSL